MAESPQTLHAYQKLHALVIEGSFSHEEKTGVWQTVNVEHGCSYCVPAHTAIARSMRYRKNSITPFANMSRSTMQKMSGREQFAFCTDRFYYRKKMVWIRHAVTNCLG